MWRPLGFATLIILFSLPAKGQVSESDILDQVDPEKQKWVEKEIREDIEGPSEAGDLGRENFRILITADFGLNYVFNDSPDSFVIQYKMKIDNRAKNKVDVIKGSAPVSTQVQGFLAKWPTGGCELHVSVSAVPYEIIFSKVSEEKIQLSTKLDEEILERWESNCKFEDAPRKKFNTIGNPEAWLKEALHKTAHLLRGVKIPVDRLHKQTTKVQFKIERFITADPPMGSAELDGKGMIEIIPES